MNNGNNNFIWMLHSPQASVIEISQEEFLLFHSIDRELYSILVFNLARQPIQSIRVLAFWIWLERVGYRRMIEKILGEVPPVINEIANEAVRCLNCIAKETFFAFNDIPVTRRLMERDFSLEILHGYRISALRSVHEAVRDVCLKVVGDLMHQGLIIQRYNTIMAGPCYRR